MSADIPGWHRIKHSVLVRDCGRFYVVRHHVGRKNGESYYYNGWKGKHNEREFREYVSAGYSRDEVIAACEEAAKS